ncbi:hypothetical protein HDE_04176 [Halotydeus destructor]|nr:hypothetical protein HDE_04176 [Halotydeus destructor]
MYNLNIAVLLLCASSLANSQEWIKGPARFEYLVISKETKSLTQSEAESGCLEKGSSLPSLSNNGELTFIGNTFGITHFWTSGSPQVVHDQILQMWPDNTPVTLRSAVSCATLPLSCAVAVSSGNLWSVLRQTKRSVSHVCQRRVSAEDRQIAGTNGIDYFLIDSPMNYADAQLKCQSKKLSLPSFFDRTALRFVTAMIDEAHTYWTKAELSDDGISYQWSNKVAVGKDIEVSPTCKDNLDECHLASRTGKLTVFPEYQLASIVICAGYRNAFQFQDEDIPFTVNNMPTSMVIEAIVVARRAIQTVRDVEGQKQLIVEHLDLTYGQKWSCSIQSEDGAILTTRPRKSQKNFSQFIIDGAVVTLYQTVSKA